MIKIRLANLVVSVNQCFAIHSTFVLFVFWWKCLYCHFEGTFKSIALTWDSIIKKGSCETSYKHTCSEENCDDLVQLLHPWNYHTFISVKVIYILVCDSFFYGEKGISHINFFWGVRQATSWSVKGFRKSTSLCFGQIRQATNLWHLKGVRQGTSLKPIVF